MQIELLWAFLDVVLVFVALLFARKVAETQLEELQPLKILIVSVTYGVIAFFLQKMFEYVLIHHSLGFFPAAILFLFLHISVLMMLLYFVAQITLKDAFLWGVSAFILLIIMKTTLYFVGKNIFHGKFSMPAPISSETSSRRVGVEGFYIEMPLAEASRVISQKQCLSAPQPSSMTICRENSLHILGGEAIPISSLYLYFATDGKLERIVTPIKLYSGTLEEMQSLFATIEKELTKLYGQPSQSVSIPPNKSAKVWCFISPQVEIDLWGIYKTDRSMLQLWIESGECRPQELFKEGNNRK